MKNRRSLVLIIGPKDRNQGIYHSKSFPFQSEFKMEQIIFIIWKKLHVFMSAKANLCGDHFTQIFHYINDNTIV